MSSVRIRPGPVLGSMRAPASKSYTHRALVVGHLSGRPFTVLHPLDSEDTRATATALTQLGSTVRRSLESWNLQPRHPRRRSRTVRIDCRESGTTLRFMAALAARSETPVALTGSKRLAKRPIGELLDALRTLGATARPTGAAGLPVEIRGPIHGGSVELDVSQSSQFASALLLTLPTLREDSSIHLRGTLVSEPYMEATLAVLAYHGISATRRGRHIRIPGRQRFRRSVFRVPGDASSAAYLWAAAALGGGRVRVHGIPEGWPQADLAVLDLLGSAGAAVERASDGATVAGVERRPFRVDLTDAPDLYPLAGVLAATTSGESRISGAEHVVWKESDRREGTAGLARQFGARARVEGSSLVVTGTDRPRPIVLAHSTDHRVVMSAAVGALAASDPSRVGEAEAVRKSFPEFWNALSELSRGRQRW